MMLRVDGIRNQASEFPTKYIFKNFGASKVNVSRSPPREFSRPDVHRTEEWRLRQLCDKCAGPSAILLPLTPPECVQTHAATLDHH